MSFRSAFVVLRVGQGSLGRARRVFVDMRDGTQNMKFNVNTSEMRLGICWDDVKRDFSYKICI